MFLVIRILVEYLKTSGGTLSGNLEVNTGTKEPQIIAKRNVGNVETAIINRVDSDGVGVVRLTKNGSAVNSMYLSNNETRFTKPVSVSSGGVPVNGKTGQILTKNENDVSWSDPSSIDLYSIGNRASIPQGTDLNTITDIGNYCVQYTDTAQTIPNTPHGSEASSISMAFILTVEKTNRADGLYIRQLYQELGVSDPLYFRTSIDGGVNWGVWNRYTLYSDLSGVLTLPSLGVEATANEINQLKGIKENVQDQLDRIFSALGIQ